MGLFPTLHEARGSLATPERWLVNWASGGSESNSGVQVSEANALTFSAVYCAVAQISGTLMQMPFYLYQEMPDGGKRKALEHNMYWVAFKKFNERVTAARAKQTLQSHLLLWGNAYIQKIYDRLGRIKSLHILRPDKMTVKTENGKIVYEYQLNNSTPKTLRAKEVIHIAGLGFDGIKGYSVVSLARESIGLGIAYEEFAARFFGNGAHPGLIANIPGRMDQVAKDQLKLELNQTLTGLDKSHQIAVISGGEVKFDKITMPLTDAEFLASRKFEVTEIARWFNIPPHKLKDMEKTNFTNIEHSNTDYDIDTMGPWEVLWEQQFDIDTLPKEEQKTYFYKFDNQELLRGDTEARYSSYQIGRQNGFLSANDVRARENMNPIEGGDVYLVPLNMVPADQVGTMDNGGSRSFESNKRSLPIENRSVKHRNRISKAYKRLINDAASRVVRGEVNNIKKEINKRIKNNELNEFNVWLDEFQKEDSVYVEKNMSPVFQSFADEIFAATHDEVGGEGERTVEFDKYVDDYSAGYTSRHVNSTVGQIRSLVDKTPEEELPEVLEQRLDEWEEKRPDKIALNESVRGDNAFASYVILSAGFDLVWRTQGESCPFCESLNGKKVGRGGVFATTGDILNPDDADGTMEIKSPTMHPPLHQGCDCTITAG